MIQLGQYYPGDENWIAFSTLYTTMPEPAVVMELKSIFPDEALAYDIRGIMDDAAVAWIEKEMPALDHLRPADCGGKTELEKRLK